MCSPKKSKYATSHKQEPEESQPPDDSRRQHSSPPSAGSQLPETTSIGVTSSPAGILDSIIGSGVYPHTRAAVKFLGTTAAAAGTAYIDELRPPGTAKGSTEFYGMCTESLGFESMTETMDLCKAIEEQSSRLISSRKTKMCGVTRYKWRLKVFPPILSSLDGNGGPRFSLEKVIRSDGRLSIIKVDNNADIVGGVGDVAPRMVEIRHDDDHQEMIGDGNDDMNQTVEMTGGGQDYDGNKKN